MTPGGKIRVLIVDDSAFMCKVLQSIISADPEMEVVGLARDGREGVAKAESLNPDVITMDINMPHVDGLQATEIIMSSKPRPIVIVSSESREGAETTLKALELGAIDFVAKPSSAIDLDMNSVRQELCRKLKLAAKVRVVRTATRSAFVQGFSSAEMAASASASSSPMPRASLAPPVAPAPVSPSFAATLPARGTGRLPVVVIAASTGGPATLMKFVPMFPNNFPGAILLIQHMPGAFSTKFSQQLAEIAAIRVKEAEQGELMQPGTMYVCPGSHHLRISPTGRITLDDGPRVSGYRPCANLTMETLAAFAGPMSTAVILTGMGTDGARGVIAIKNAGGYVLAQDESTSVIFGMNAEAIKTGAVDHVLPLEAIYPAIEKRVLYTFGAAKVGAL
ncbi:MAG: chemotaxis response regulator protein-glutamate methylesterase [Terriglobales bacterium]